jgi:hypothetical protein
MIVGNPFDQLRLTLCNPFLLLRMLTAWTGSVVAGGIVDEYLPTVLADTPGIAQITSLATHDHAGNFTLVFWEIWMLCFVLWVEALKDVPDRIALVGCLDLSH